MKNKEQIQAILDEKLNKLNINKETSINAPTMEKAYLYVERQQLEVEIKLLRDLLENPEPIKVPQPLDDSQINLSELKRLVKQYIDCLSDDEKIRDTDFYSLEIEIFEKAMEAIYGVGIFDFINNRLK
jgi:hypothetical protein